MSNEGELSVSYTNRVKHFTLDPIREKIINTPWKEVESTIPCGFRTEWVSGEDDEGNEFELAVGAGAGSPWMTFEYKGHHYCVNVQDIIMELIAFTNET